MLSRIFKALLMVSVVVLPFRSVSSGYQTQPAVQTNSGAIVSIVSLPAMSLDSLVETSDLVVLGELVTVNQATANGTVEVSGKPVKVRIDRGTLRIDEVLRGAQQSPLVFEMMQPLQDIGWGAPAPQTHGLFFFRVGENQTVTFTSPYYPVISTPQDLQSRGDTVMDRVVSILGDTLRRPYGRGGLNYQVLPYLMFSKSKAANAVLRDALNTVADPQLSVQIVNGLLLQGDRSSLGFIKQLFLTGPNIPMDDRQEEALGNVMGAYLKDPDAIADLEDLIGAPSVHIRRGAAGALRGTQSPKALRGLARALEDTDFKVRYWAVVGLAEINNQKDWRPNESLFKSDESRFLTHWKEWARNR